MRGLWYLTLGLVAFVAITYFEQLPVLGWLGSAISVGAWIVLGRALVAQRGWDFDAPVALAWAAVVGGVTGFVGAFTAWLAQTGNLIALSTQPGDRLGAAFGFVGAVLGMVYWPLVGAAVCVIAAFLALGSRRTVRL